MTVKTALDRLARMREEAGDRAEAERLARQAADAGHPTGSWLKSLWPYGLEPDGTPSEPW